MSDEEDTSILLSGKNEDHEKINTTIVVRQSVAVSGPNVIEVTSRNHVSILLASFVAAMGGLAFGYDMGIGSNTMSQVKDTFELTCTQQQLMGSTWLIGAIIASFVGGIVIDGCGRRWAICCTAILMVLGSVISALASSYPLLLFGRLVGGFAGALSAVTQCIYAAEVSEAHSRGRAVLLHQVGVAAGVLLSSIAVTGDDTQWRMVMWLSAIPAGLHGLVALFFLPHSPHFKLLQMSHSLQTKHSPTCCVMGNLAETLLLAFGLVFFQQFSGRPAVLYYAPRVFMLVGVCPEAAFTVAAIILNIIKVGAVSLSLCVVDKIGRRPSLIVGATCMMTSIALLGMISAMEDNEVDVLPNPVLEPCGSIEMESVPVLPSGTGFHYTTGIGMASALLPTGVPPPFPLLPTPVSLVAEDTYAGVSPWCPVSADTSLAPSLRYLALFALICYEIAFSFGLGPVTWLLLTEMFPASVKGRTVALTASLHWFADLITPVAFISFINAVTVSGAFLCHSVVCLSAIFFIFLFIPETRGKSLHQIAQGLKNVSSKTRMFQNLQGLPCLSTNVWLQQKSRQYRQVSHATVESTII